MHDYDNYRYICKEKCIELTCKENELLKILIENKGKILTTNTLLAMLFPKSLSVKALDQLICRLRKKIKNEVSIKNKHGIGYGV